VSKTKNRLAPPNDRLIVHTPDTEELHEFAVLLALVRDTAQESCNLKRLF
jgi:hypothetical protein